jgi:hypothetical protein
MVRDEAWLAGRTLRWHTHPVMNNAVWQTVADHSWGVVTLMLKLWPDSRIEAVTAAHRHDTGERSSGADVSWSAKQRWPAVFAQVAVIEAQERQRIFGPDLDLTDEELDRIRLCDRIESALTVMNYAPWIMPESEWVELGEWMDEEAERLGVRVAVGDMLW